ncbi:hypothetical protein NSK_005561 [Nannochloropsis salina CCMP1776]|uniref:PH domain-containing protein n=1 Tax=Nannochloropsis salina CCMP1776 TaxID=1027361 RepID=A0A4D9CV12_9STRA|nr:hypothetical protein NSK_005561 [Nannochloropsis salina CCMP1776]|eukprot:TFJ83141.1 hypothetical protein NSK_005561 [Nannochloropsis salina CCMP1776]
MSRNCLIGVGGLLFVHWASLSMSLPSLPGERFSSIQTSTAFFPRRYAPIGFLSSIGPNRPPLLLSRSQHCRSRAQTRRGDGSSYPFSSRWRRGPDWSVRQASADGVQGPGELDFYFSYPASGRKRTEEGGGEGGREGPGEGAMVPDESARARQRSDSNVVHRQNEAEEEDLAERVGKAGESVREEARRPGSSPRAGGKEGRKAAREGGPQGGLGEIEESKSPPGAVVPVLAGALEDDLARSGAGQEEKSATRGATKRWELERGDETGGEEEEPLINRVVGGMLNGLDLSAGAYTLSAPVEGGREGGRGERGPEAKRRVDWRGLYFSLRDRFFPDFNHVKWGERLLTRLVKKLDRTVVNLQDKFGWEGFRRVPSPHSLIVSFPPFPTVSSVDHFSSPRCQLGFILASGVSWETILRLIQAELRAFREEGIDPLSESVARELFFVAASKVFPDLPLDEWNRNVESLSDRTRKLWWESQMKARDGEGGKEGKGELDANSSSYNASPSSLYSPYSYSNRTLAAAATGNDLKRWLESLEAALILAGVGIVDDSGKTPTAALREVGENLERLKQQSEDLLLLIEDEIRYIAKGGKPETSIKHLGESVKREEIVHEIIEIDEEELEAMVGDEEGDWF